MDSLADALSPERDQDDFTRLMRDEFDYIGARRLEDGTYIGLQRLMFTVAICVGVTPMSAYTRRYCFDDLSVCVSQFLKLSKGSDEVTGWIATRPVLDSDSD